MDKPHVWTGMATGTQECQGFSFDCGWTGLIKMAIVQSHCPETLKQAKHTLMNMHLSSDIFQDEYSRIGLESVAVSVSRHDYLG
jgi:hypothetical protein